MEDFEILQVELTDLPDDVEIIAGPKQGMEQLARMLNSKALSFKRITREEAYQFLQDIQEDVAPGIFIHDPNNILINEDRRKRADDLLLYIASRTGVGSIHHSIGIDEESKQLIID